MDEGQSVSALGGVETPVHTTGVSVLWCGGHVWAGP